MIISYCMPCHKRTHDLRWVLPSLVAAANNSPPVEIMVLNYNSGDGLEEYIKGFSKPIIEGNSIRHVKYSGRDYYHMAHARNLSIIHSTGEYFVNAGTDRFLELGFFNAIREEISKGAIWVQPSNKKKFIGVIACQKKEFIEAGGYDERFEFYGPEDKEIWARLERRGKQFGVYNSALQSAIRTNKSDKVKNYRVGRTQKIRNRMRTVHRENNENKVLTVNKDGWGEGEVVALVREGGNSANTTM